MSNGSFSSHYVPRLVLRKFSNRLCTYNIKTGELRENIATEHAFAQNALYDLNTERALNTKVESQFGNLLANILLKADHTVSLNRMQLLQVKKFLLVSELRTMQNEEWLQKERQMKNSFAPDFKERRIEGETPYEYWMRTVNTVLDSDGTPASILQNSNKTYPAYRWANIVNSGYIAFWDAPESGDEFVITDIGMTSENEKDWDGITRHNDKKLSWLTDILNRTTNDEEKDVIASLIKSLIHFSENFMMFPISAKRMIVLINPFYKFRYAGMKSGLSCVPLTELTLIPNESLFVPNHNYYEATKGEQNSGVYSENDQYIYDIKKLASDEIQYCNALFMDRINEYLGFSSLDSAFGSIIKYKLLNDPPYTPRVDYTPLYRIIEKRYSCKLIFPY